MTAHDLPSASGAILIWSSPVVSTSRVVCQISATTVLDSGADSQAAASPDSPVATEEDAAVARMEEQKAEIITRVGMSAPMELPEAGEEDFIEKAREEGWMIEVTLEEVEAALKAAAATPSHEDDIAAMRLAHRGSYRFYLDEQGSAEEPATAR